MLIPPRAARIALMAIAVLIIGSSGVPSASWAEDRTATEGAKPAKKRAKKSARKQAKKRARARARARARDRRRASRHLDRGLAFYNKREFQRAIAEFRAGYRIDPRAEFLFALAQAERLSGDCASAIVYYERFLATGPPRSQARAARMHMARCKKAISSGPGRGLHNAGQDGGGRGRSPRPHELTGRPHELTGGRDALLAPASLGRSRHSPWYHDAAGDILLGSGALSMAVGIVFLSSSKSAEDHAGVAPTYPEYNVHMERARRHRDWGAVALVGGVALTTGAIIRFVTRRSGEDDRGRSKPGVSLVPTSSSVGVVYRGRF